MWDMYSALVISISFNDNIIHKIQLSYHKNNYKLQTINCVTSEALKADSNSTALKDKSPTESLRSDSCISCQRDTARDLLLNAICCCAPCCSAGRLAAAAVDRYLPPARRSAANPPLRRVKR